MVHPIFMTFLEGTHGNYKTNLYFPSDATAMVHNPLWAWTIRSSDTGQHVRDWGLIDTWTEKDPELNMDQLSFIVVVGTCVWVIIFAAHNTLKLG